MTFDPVTLPVWHLTLPAFENPECDESEWGNPYTWPGGWNHFQNANAMIVTAEDAPQARVLAAERDCPIWLDQAYARCRPLSVDTPGVILSSGSGADNE